jgi:hypothetical protein
MDAEPIVNAVAEELHDPLHARWSPETLAEYLTSALRMVVGIRPDTTQTVDTLTLADGHLHPSPGLRFIRLDCNVLPDGSDGDAITPCDIEVLDRFEPSWRRSRPRSRVEHYGWVPHRPREFLTVPPAALGTKVRIAYAADPGPIAAPSAPGDIWPEIQISPDYENAVRHWMLFRAYALQTSAVGKDQARAHYSMFFSSMGEKVPGQVFLSGVEGQ